MEINDLEEINYNDEDININYYIEYFDKLIKLKNIDELKNEEDIHEYFELICEYYYFYESLYSDDKKIIGLTGNTLNENEIIILIGKLSQKQTQYDSILNKIKGTRAQKMIVLKDIYNEFQEIFPDFGIDTDKIEGGSQLRLINVYEMIAINYLLDNQEDDFHIIYNKLIYYYKNYGNENETILTENYKSILIDIEEYKKLLEEYKNLALKTELKPEIIQRPMITVGGNNINETMFDFHFDKNDYTEHEILSMIDTFHDGDRLDLRRREPIIDFFGYTRENNSYAIKEESKEKKSKLFSDLFIDKNKYFKNKQINIYGIPNFINNNMIRNIIFENYFNKSKDEIEIDQNFNGFKNEIPKIEFLIDSAGRDYSKFIEKITGEKDKFKFKQTYECKHWYKVFDSAPATFDIEQSIETYNRNETILTGFFKQGLKDVSKKMVKEKLTISANNLGKTMLSLLRNFENTIYKKLEDLYKNLINSKLNDKYEKIQFLLNIKKSGDYGQVEIVKKLNEQNDKLYVFYSIDFYACMYAKLLNVPFILNEKEAWYCYNNKKITKVLK